MLLLIAEADRDQALTKGYLLLFMIALAGLIGVLLLIGWFLMWRYTRRRLRAIEQDKAERRQARSTGRVDTWRAGADRYIDRDKLTEQELAQEDGGPGMGGDTGGEEDPDAAEDEDEDDLPPGWDGREEETDPYGLFDGTPYRETEEDDAFDDDDEQDEDDDWDEEDPKR